MEQNILRELADRRRKFWQEFKLKSGRGSFEDWLLDQLELARREEEVIRKDERKRIATALLKLDQ